MKREVPIPLVVAIVVVFCALAGAVVWHNANPTEVIVPKGKMPPPPRINYGGVGPKGSAMLTGRPGQAGGAPAGLVLKR